MNTGYRLKQITICCSLLLSVLRVSALDPDKSIYQFNCQNWTRQSGLPAGRINTIAQTKDGYLWLGTQSGLVRFDGIAFATFTIDQTEARGREVRSLIGSGRGDLLVTINNGAFGRFDGAKFTLINDPTWPQANLTGKTMMETRNGAVWIGSNLGAGCTVAGDPTAGYFVETSKRVFSLCEDPAGQTWVGLDNGSVLRLTKNQRIPVNDPALANDVIYAIVADNAGHVWVGGAKALRSYDSEGRPTDIPPFLNAGVNAMLLDRHGVLWIGTERTGLLRYADGKFTTLSAADGLVSDHITSLYEDAEGSLWVGTRDGLSQLSDIKFPIFSEKEGIAPGSGHLVVAARKGGLWIATSQGACFFDGGTVARLVDDTVLSDRYVKHLAEAPNGDVYLTDAKLNLNVMSGDKLIARYACNKWSEALAVDGEGVVMGQGSNLMRLRDGNLIPYPFAEGQDINFQWFVNICVASDGAIWLPTYTGIFRIKEGRTQKFVIADARPEDRLYFIMQDIDGSMWAAGSAGLIRVKNGQLKHITTKNGLGDDLIYAIVADDHGCFWLDSSRGIIRVSRQNLNDFADGRADKVTCDIYEGLDAVKHTDRTDQSYSGCKTNDGRIWFPNVHGVVMVDPVNFFTNKVAPPVHIEQIRVDGKSLPGSEPRALPVGAERVEFFFSAPSFIAPQKMQVRYRLEGVDKGWIEAGAKRSILYGNLRHGSYTFRIQACNADGVWNSEGAACKIEMPPHFYETLWFYLLCGVSGLTVVVGAFRWKVRHMELRQRRLQAENDLLESKVADRTKELSYERDLLRTLLDSSPDAIYFKDTQSRFVKVGRAIAQSLGVAEPDALVGRSDSDFFDAKHAQEAQADEQAILKSGRPILGKIEREVRPDGVKAWVLTSKIPWRGKNGEIVGTFGVSKDITAIKEAEQKLVDVHKQLVETSRQAGMAEVATSVLHNVGNVLNSVNVSATLVADRIGTSKVSNLPKISSMLQSHTADLATFLTSDPKGSAIVPYLATLGVDLIAEQGLLKAELVVLQKNIEHIKEIVAMQQNYAKVSGVAETVPLSEIVEDAIRLNSGALDRHQVELVRDYLDQPTLTLERHKLLQILVNLIRNSKYACDDSARSDKRITIRIVQDAEAVRLSVIDNGIGIPPENLTRIFEHGFTTRKSGHGFGLHSGALTAKELGGSLTAQSEGPGMGAMFTINLPLPLKES